MVRCRPTANPPFCKQEHGAALPSAQPIITMPIQDTLPVFLWPKFAFSVIIPYNSFVEDKFNDMASHTQFIENRSISYHSIPSWRAAAEQLLSYWTIKWILQENKYLCSQISVSWEEANGAKPPFRTTIGLRIFSTKTTKNRKAKQRRIESLCKARAEAKFSGIMPSRRQRYIYTNPLAV